VNKLKCSPYADERQCKLRGVLDGEQWCETHSAYSWRRWEWQLWQQKQVIQKRAAKKEKEN
jgi:hypothetical protein